MKKKHKLDNHIRCATMTNMNNKTDFIYNTVIEKSDIAFQMRGDFETYMTENNGICGFAIGYNKKTHQYGFKRYFLVNTLYKVFDISQDTKPNYAKLYEQTKNAYMERIIIANIQDLEI